MSLEQRIQELETQLAQERRRATDAEYMLNAIVPMLGPKGREVWNMWKEHNVVRVHMDWAEDPMNMEGEVVAGLHLSFEKAARNATPVNDIDA